MYEVECDQNNDQKIGTLQLDIKMMHTRDSTHDKKKYNLVSCYEEVVVFVADDCELPIEIDVSLREFSYIRGYKKIVK